MRKQCSKCKKWYDTRHFHLNRSTADGLQSYCKSCQKSLHRAWSQRNKPQVAAMARRAYAKRQMIKRIIAVDQMKQCPKPTELPSDSVPKYATPAPLTCARCRETKSPLLFPRRKASPTGRHAMCSSCLKERVKRKKRTTKETNK